MSFLLKQASSTTWDRTPSTDAIVDVRIEDGVIVEIGPDLARRPGESIYDVGGDILAPGLHDHHIHLRALAAVESSVVVGPPEIQSLDELSERLRRASVRLLPGQWIRGIGYHEKVAGDLDRWVLDRLVPNRPIRIQHATGALWMLNSKAIEACGIGHDAPVGAERGPDGVLTGRFWREDDWLGGRLPRTSHDFTALSQQAASRGVTGITEATPGATDAEVAGFVHAIESNTLVQRIHMMVEPEVTDPVSPLISLGPTKIVLDDLALPPFDELVDRITEVHDRGRPVAVHCVTRTQGVITIAALEQVGCHRGDRIEHGSILGPESMAQIAALGITMVTQPGFVATRGDRFLRDVPAPSQPDLWRLGTLLEAGITVAGSTDAPFGDPDPWMAIKAACTRRSLTGQVVGAGEAIDLETAIGLFLGEAANPGRQRRIALGAPADLCVVAAESWSAGSHVEPWVRATFVAGRPVYTAP